jgi:hypothetical protein
MPDLPSGTVTFLFTDIEGSTKRWEHVAVVPRIRREDALKKGWPDGHPSPDCFGS